MPAITTTTVAGTPLDKILQDVLNTKPNEWKYFFQRPDFIKDIFEKLANTIQSRNFFSEDYSINTFLNFIKSYVSAKLTKNDLINVDSEILQKFNDLWISIHNRIIQQDGLNEEKCSIIMNYIGFVHNLLDWQHRDLFTKFEITFAADDFQAIARMLKHNSASINETIIENYTSLLKLSFDTPKFLSKFQLGLNVIPLAKASFLNKQLNIHIIVTGFFSLLGYQGQLLEYYHEDARFNISKELLANSYIELKNKTIELQTYFFKHLQNRDDIDKPLLQHYLYTYFFKVFFIKYPDRLKDEVKDSWLLKYIKLDYVGLPKSLLCKNFPAEYVVQIEYNNLPANVPQMACEAIRCSYQSNENWKQDLNLALPRFKSHYIFRVADSEPKYKVTYSYGHTPVGSGFYIQKPRIDETVYGEGYCYWNNNTHNFIEVSRHEARHHDNYVFTTEAYSVNRNITGITVKSPNEGLAVNSNGPCAPGFIDGNFSDATAPSFSNLFEKPFIGYFDAWLETNYLIQEHPDFYRDSLSLDKQQFKQRWEPLLIKNQQHFRDWLIILNQTCSFAPRELTLESCPSIFLKDYASGTVLENSSTSVSSKKVTETLQKLSVFSIKIPSADEMGYQLIFKINQRKYDEFRTLLENGANANYYIEDTGNTPLHFLYVYGNCNVEYLEALLNFGAKVTPNYQGQFPIQIAEKNCDATELLKIKEIFTRHAQQQKLSLSIIMPITSFVNGVISGWSEEIVQRNSESRYIPNIIFYGVKPATFAISNSAINILLAGSAEAIGLDDIGLSFTYYLVMNYLGLMLAQFGEGITNKIQNKFLSIVMSISLYAFFLNPSLLVLLISEGFMALNVQSILQPLLSLLSGGIFFKAGGYSGQKFYQKFFPINPSDTVTSQQDYFLRYSLDGAEKRISVEEKTLQEIKDKLEHFNKKLKKHIDEQAYLLSFDENFKIANDNLLLLLNKCQENEESYGKIFDTFKVNLRNIQKNLNSLLEKIQSKKDKSEIKTLWNEITNILPLVSQIQPLPLVQKTPDLVANHGTGVTEENEQSLSLIKSINGKANGYPGSKTFRYTRPPTMLEKMYTFFVRPGEQKSEFPDPPTQEQLHEMGIFTKENDRKFNLNGS